MQNQEPSYFIETNIGVKLLRRILAATRVLFPSIRKNLLRETNPVSSKNGLLIIIDAAPPASFEGAVTRDEVDSQFLKYADKTYLNMLAFAANFEKCGGHVLLASPIEFPDTSQLGFGFKKLDPNFHLSKAFVGKYESVFFAGISLSDCVIGRASGYFLVPHRNKIVLSDLSIQIDPIRDRADLFSEVAGLKISASNKRGFFGARDKTITDFFAFEELQSRARERLETFGVRHSRSVQLPSK